VGRKKKTKSNPRGLGRREERMKVPSATKENEKGGVLQRGGGKKKRKNQRLLPLPSGLVNSARKRGKEKGGEGKRKKGEDDYVVAHCHR